MVTRAGIVAVGVALAVASVGLAAKPPAVSVEPAIGTPHTAFHVSVAATFPIRQLRDRYWFILRGPGGRACDERVTDRVGITPARSAKQVAVDLPGVRVVNRREIVPGPWCEGQFSGHVEFSDWRPRARRDVVHRIGDFSVQVGSEK
jgi:hypothetical protein